MVLFWYYVVKKRLYRFRPRDAQNVSRTTGDEHRVNAEQIPEEDLATDNTDLEHPDSHDEQLNNESSETNQQFLVFILQEQAQLAIICHLRWGRHCC